MAGRGAVVLCCLLTVTVVIPLDGVSAGRSMPRRRLPSSSTSTPSGTADAAAAARRSAYRRFHANDSHVEKPVPCTRDEKLCFRYNLVFDPTTDRCQPLGGGFAAGCDLRANSTEFERGSGHVIGTCRGYEDPCPGYRMAYDGRCYPKELVRDVICGCNAEPTRHFLGGVECRCSPSMKVRVEQPSKEGQCRIPDFSFPDVNRTSFLALSINAQNSSNVTVSNKKTDPVKSNCSTEQRRCFSHGKVWVAVGRDCHVLLEKGPCVEGYVVVLDKDAKGKKAAVCMHKSGGCQPGFVRMAFDGQCHNEREMIISAPGRIALNVFGEYVVVGVTEVLSYTPSVENENCVIQSQRFASPPRTIQYHKPVCSDSDRAQCFLHEVHTVPPVKA